MEDAVKPVKKETLPLGWKLAILAPLAAALTLLLLATRQSELHREILLSTLGTMLVMVSNIAVSVYWIVARKAVGWGIALLIFGSAVVGFAVHTLLRVI